MPKNGIFSKVFLNGPASNREFPKWTSPNQEFLKWASQYWEFLKWVAQFGISRLAPFGNSCFGLAHFRNS